MGILSHNDDRFVHWLRGIAMRSSVLGECTSAAEVTNVSRHGIWLLSATGEKFFSFKDFPWFMEAPIGKVMNVEEPQPGHYYWPDLDVDLSDRIIEAPHLYPRVSR